MVAGKHCKKNELVDVSSDVAFNIIAANRAKPAEEKKVKAESEAPVETEIQVKESALPQQRRR